MPEALPAPPSRRFRQSVLGGFFRHVVGIHGHCHREVGVAKPLTNLPRALTMRNLLRRKGMPQIMQPDARGATQKVVTMYYGL
jgi:hypothetical protein